MVLRNSWVMIVCPHFHWVLLWSWTTLQVSLHILRFCKHIQTLEWESQKSLWLCLCWPPSSIAVGQRGETKSWSRRLWIGYLLFTQQDPGMPKFQGLFHAWINFSSVLTCKTIGQTNTKSTTFKILNNNKKRFRTRTTFNVRLLHTYFLPLR